MEKEVTFHRWVDEYSDNLYHYLLVRLEDKELCKDIVQETFLAAWRNMDGFRGHASVKSWLYVILKSKLTDHYRRMAKQVNAEALQNENTNTIYFDEHDHWREGMHPKEWSVNFSNPVEVKEFRQVFLSCSSKLKRLQQLVFAMKYVDGTSSGEICRELNISPANYWVLMHRAKLQLRACLEKNWLQK